MFSYGFARNIMKFFHSNFGNLFSTLAHDHPLGTEGNQVFPTSTYTTPAGDAASLMHKPKDNGGWDVEAHLHPPAAGHADPLSFNLLTQGYTVQVNGDGITVLDSSNTVTFQVP